jgi:multiple antibiotic resistance protein
MDHLLHSIITVLAVTNPLGNAPIFLTIVAGASRREQMHDALVGFIAVLAILVLSAVAGKALLEAFGISIDAFRVAGGLVIGLMGLHMLQGQHSSVQHDPEHVDSPDAQVIVPFAMPLVAGPGGITTVITLSASHPSGMAHALIASIVAAAILLGVLMLLIQQSKLLTPQRQKIITRFMGLILVAMGFQFALDGFAAFFHLSST